MNWIKQNLIVILPAIAMGYGWGWRGPTGMFGGAVFGSLAGSALYVLDIILYWIKS